MRQICPRTEDGIPGSLGVKPLDDLLQVFAAPHQSRADHENPNLQSEDGHGHGNAGTTRITPSEPVVEISSTSSGAGKSQLLYYLTAVAILPSTLDETQLGKNAAVVFIDADYRFDALRLRTIARGIIQQKLNQDHDDIEDMLVDSLQHVHVFRPDSSASILATLKSLDAYLFDLSRHVSSTRPVQAIFIDSATAFFWQDKLRDQVARTEEIGRPYAEIELARSRKQSFYITDMYAELVRELKRLQRVFGCAVVYTTTAWVARSHVLDSAGAAPVAFRCALPPPWGLFPTLRLVVRSFPAAVTTVRDAGLSRFLGCVNGLGREEWPRRITEGLDGRGKGTFVFYTGRDGVYIGIPGT